MRASPDDLDLQDDACDALADIADARKGIAHGIAIVGLLDRIFCFRVIERGRQHRDPSTPRIVERPVVARARRRRAILRVVPMHCG